MAAKKRGAKTRARKAAKRGRKSARRPQRSRRSRGASSLAAMSLDALISMRDEAERLIKTRASAERKALERQLLRIGEYFGETAKRPAKAKSPKGRKAAPKYRNPANRSQTWAGRGTRPRWLQAQLKEGRKIEEFAVR
jgi:DNA-binding protein H-NS